MVKMRLLAVVLSLPLPAQALDFADLALEGELRFLADRPDPGAYRYSSSLHISPESLDTGEVQLATCHHQLDPNSKIVIAFNPQRVRQIEVTATEGVQQARVEGHRVVLSDVQRGGRACIRIRSQALERTGENQWRLYAGPLMRRYLDGYLPMQASLAFHWPDGLLRLHQTHPASQPGVSVRSSSDGAQLDLVFAGRMTATIDLIRPVP